MELVRWRRAVRVLSAALLASDFSDEEVLEIANALRRDRRFTADIARVWRDAIIDSRSSRVSLPSTSRRSTSSDWIATMEDVIKQQRLSKRELVAVMSALVPKLPRSEFGFHQTVHSLLQAFDQHASSAAKNQLLEWIHSPGSTRDAYMEGILRK